MYITRHFGDISLKFCCFVLLACSNFAITLTFCAVSIDVASTTLPFVKWRWRFPFPAYQVCPDPTKLCKSGSHKTMRIRIGKTMLIRILQKQCVSGSDKTLRIQRRQNDAYLDLTKLCVSGSNKTMHIWIRLNYV